MHKDVGILSSDLFLLLSNLISRLVGYSLMSLGNLDFSFHDVYGTSQFIFYTHTPFIPYMYLSLGNIALCIVATSVCNDQYVVHVLILYSRNDSVDKCIRRQGLDFIPGTIT